MCTIFERWRFDALGDNRDQLKVKVLAYGQLGKLMCHAQILFNHLFEYYFKNLMKLNLKLISLILVVE
jgi:hypothetical protein